MSDPSDICSAPNCERRRDQHTGVRHPFTEKKKPKTAKEKIFDQIEDNGMEKWILRFDISDVKFAMGNDFTKKCMHLRIAIKEWDEALVDAGWNEYNV